MTQCNTLNVNLFYSKLNKLKLGIKNGTEVTLKISLNVLGDSNNENNFPHKLLLNTTQFSRFNKVFLNASSANIKLSKIEIIKNCIKLDIQEDF